MRIEFAARDFTPRKEEEKIITSQDQISEQSIITPDEARWIMYFQDL